MSHEKQTPFELPVGDPRFAVSSGDFEGRELRRLKNVDQQ
jgi:hypothetical protein